MRTARIVVALAAVLLVAGCETARGTFAEAVVARDECHDVGGAFVSDKNDYGEYIWECDLSDQ